MRLAPDADGAWRVRFDPYPAGGPHRIVVEGSGSGAEIVCEDVWFGEVWVCSGQSNMEWNVKRSRDPDQETRNAAFPKIRLFQVKKKVSREPLRDTEGSWKVCSPDTIPGFTAVGYFFGRKLHRDLGVPVGLIQSAWGGTPAEAWTSHGKLAKKNAGFKTILDRWERIAKEYPTKMAAWNKKAAEAKAAGKRAPRGRPRSPTHAHSASGLYNGMISPLLGFRIRGAIWYQGESNASRAYEYRRLFPAMIQDWRTTWGQGDFPFGFVQLANFQTGNSPAWAELREAQLMALSEPNTGMAVTIDIGNARDIHPKNKQDVGRRLALWALAKVYDKELVYSGPMFARKTIEAGAVRLHFVHRGGGLKARGDGALAGFEIASVDGEFVPATASIDGETVVVRSEAVAKPAHVRYAWENNPEKANLMNAERLPASPFRTDDRPGVTMARR